MGAPLCRGIVTGTTLPSRPSIRFTRVTSGNLGLQPSYSLWSARVGFQRKLFGDRLDVGVEAGVTNLADEEWHHDAESTCDDALCELTHLRRDSGNLMHDDHAGTGPLGVRRMGDSV